MYNIRIKWLTIACFEMQFGNTTVVSDPCIGASPNNDLTWENIENCDIITLSHCHWDHITDLPAMMDKYPVPLLTGTLTAMPILRWLDCNPSRIYPMDANLELDFGEVKVMSLFGRHCSLPFHSVTALDAHFKKNPICTSSQAMFDLQVLGSLEYRNYLFTDKNGTKLLIWGNDVVPTQVNMLKKLQPEICILQLSKQDPVEIASMAAEIGAKVLIPHHMDLKKTREEYLPNVERCRDEFLRLVPDGRFVDPINGQWIDL